MLLDPTNIEVVDFLSPDADTDDLRDVDELSGPDLGVDNTTRIDASAFSFASTNVILQATNDITFNADIVFFTPGIGLTAEAGNDIVGNNSISTSGGKVQLIAGNNIVGNNSISTSGGEVQLIAGNDISLNTFNSGDFRNFISTSGGKVQLIAGNDISLTNGSVIMTSAFSGNSGDIEFRTGSLSLTKGSFLFADTSGGGRGGNVTVTASDAVKVIGGQSLSGINVGTEGSQPAGNIKITTGQLIFQDKVLVTTSTSGAGNAGDLTVTASDSVTVSRGSILSTKVDPEAIGNGGKLKIDTKLLLLQDRSQLTVATSGAGKAGDLTIRASDSVKLKGSSLISSTVNETATGNGGTINLETNQLTLQDGGIISVATLGEGQGGRLTVNAFESIDVIGTKSSSGIIADTTGSQPAGNIKITTGRFNVQNNAEVSTGTSGTGNGGDLIIEAADSVVVSGQAEVSTATSGAGNGGNLTINSASSILVNGAESSLISTSSEETSGNAGNINITTKQLNVRNGATVEASTFGEGSSGKLTVTASESIELTGFRSGLITQTNGSGSAGELIITTDKLLVSDGARVSAGTFGGESGSIKVTADTLEITNGGRVVTTTAASKDAGDIIIEEVNDVTLVGENSGLFANTTSESTGKGGSIFLDPRTMIIRNGASVAVNSEGTGRGGDIEIVSGSLTLDNEAAISAETRSNLGGNITLQINDDPLLLRHNSLISATAGNEQFGGDGGNITINAPFILAYPYENSDITANAFEGKGGNIDITTNAIFGIEFREALSPLSDFTVSSELGVDGNFVLDDSGIDPTRGLITLPEEPVNTEISQGCQTVRGQETVEYFEIGRGGSPPTPDESLNADTVLEDWIDLEPRSDESSDLGTTITSSQSAKTPFISPCPAQ